METSTKGMIEIASHEGIVPMPYRDSVGVWTFGVGHTKAAGNPDPATMPKGVERPIAEVFDVFRRDLRKYEHRVNDAVKVPLKQHEFDALVSFDFNTGGIYKAALTNALNAGDRAGAARKFMGWSKPKEIIPRRKKEQALFRDGIYSAKGFATVYKASMSGAVNWGSARQLDVASLLRPSLDPAPVPPPPDDPGAPAGFERLPWWVVLVRLIFPSFMKGREHG